MFSLIAQKEYSKIKCTCEVASISIVLFSQILGKIAVCTQFLAVDFFLITVRVVCILNDTIVF